MKSVGMAILAYALLGAPPSHPGANEIFPAAGAEYVGFFRICRDEAATARMARAPDRALTDMETPLPAGDVAADMSFPGCRQGIMAIRPYREIESFKDLRAWNLRADLGGKLDCGAYLEAGPRRCTAVPGPARYYQGSVYRDGHWRSAIIQAFGTNLCDTGICRVTID
jgi:hypothetical protein